MPEKHDTEKNRAVCSGTEPRRTRIRVHTRAAHRTLVSPTRTCNKLLVVYM
jgi:hypothetical protein